MRVMELFCMLFNVEITHIMVCNYQNSSNCILKTNESIVLYLNKGKEKKRRYRCGVPFLRFWMNWR